MTWRHHEHYLSQVCASPGIGGIDAGTHKSAEFMVDHGQLVVKYYSQDMTASSIITLVCDQQTEATLVVTDEDFSANSYVSQFQPLCTS